MAGVFITLEGLEGSGKSTQIEFIVSFLQRKGRQVVATREPGGALLSEKIRQLLLSNAFAGRHPDCELMLMFAARVEHVKQVIEPAIKAGKFVVCDRFYDATCAYQGYGRELDLNKIERLKKIAIGDLQPDLTLLLDVTPAVSRQRVAQRAAKDRFENEHADFHKKVRQGYLSLAANDPQRITVINASQSIADVKSAIESRLNGFLDGGVIDRDFLNKTE